MEESSRVPLLILDPRSGSAGKGWRCHRLTGNIDFAPTLLELAGLEAVKGMDGRSLMPLLENPEEGGHETLALMNTFPPAPTTCLSVLSGDFKYTYWWFEDDEMKACEELFNLKKDPFELTNLAGGEESTAVLAEMQEKYDNQLKSWRQEMVNRGAYGRYATLFDRSVPMAEKEKLLTGKSRE
jgi:arylsulfatase A-like enzyme